MRCLNKGVQEHRASNTAAWRTSQLREAFIITDAKVDEEGELVALLKI